MIADAGGTAVRRHRPLQPDVKNRAGGRGLGAVVVLLELSTGLIAQWVTMPTIQPLLMVLLVSVFVQTISLVPAARLERDLDFRRVAAIETGAPAPVEESLGAGIGRAREAVDSGAAKATLERWVAGSV